MATNTVRIAVAVACSLSQGVTAMAIRVEKAFHLMHHCSEAANGASYC